MFGGQNLSKMMEQMGMEMEELDADKVEIKVGGKTLVFDSPEISKINAQGQEIFQLQGSYREEEAGPEEEDVELVMEKTGCSQEDAVKALEENDDVAGAVMSLQ